MHRASICVALALACGPASPGDPDGASDPDPSTTADETGDETGDQTGDVLPTTGDPPAPDPTTDGPPPPSAVYVLFGLLGQPSAVAEVEQWQPEEGASCFAEPTPTCDQPPDLGPPKLLVDGALAGPESVVLGSRVAVLFPYAGCDLACGQFTVIASGHPEIGEGGGELPPGLPCSTAGAGLWLAVDFGPIDTHAPRSVELTVTDACSATAGPRKLTFAAQ